MSWAEVGAIVGILALFEAPLIILFAAALKWVWHVNCRLERIEARSHLRRRGDPPGGRYPPGPTDEISK